MSAAGGVVMWLEMCSRRSLLRVRSEPHPQGWLGEQCLLTLLLLNLLGHMRVADVAHLQACINTVHRHLLQELAGNQGGPRVTLDVDATIVASGKRKAKATYRSATRDVPYERGYPPVTVCSPEWAEFRPGNTPASKGLKDVLERALQQRRNQSIRVGFGWMRPAIKRT